jgi:dihydroorotate dehydrogenase
MNLRGIDFGHVLDASGARGWFGEGHSFHHFVPVGLDFAGSTFVAKTTTLQARRGNAVLARDGLTPRVLGQRCVKVNWRKGAVLNAFGLSGPGAQALFDTGRWQQRREPFFLSFMAIEQSAAGSLEEVRAFIRLLRQQLPRFSAKIGLQVNFSCPNVHPGDHITNFRSHLDEYQALEIPIVPKISATLPVEAALAIADHPACDAICVSNSIPWGELSDRIDWRLLFGDESPLKDLGGGGLSGAPLLPIVADWVRNARSQGLRVPVNAGGGILKPADVDVLVRAGATSVFVGSIAMLRGWRLHRTISHANDLLTARASQQAGSVAALKRA